MRILAAPNDDGFGPSALLSYVVKAILVAQPRARVTVWNHFAWDFNRQLYAREIAAGRVRVERVWNLIQLARPDGDVSGPETLRRMRDYRRESEHYGGAGPASFDLVLDFGAPAAASWAARRGLPAVTVFDHAWSETLRMVGDMESPEWREVVQAVEDDERQTGRVFLLPEFIAPARFRRHWERLLGASRVMRLAGVLREPAPWGRREAADFLGLRRPGRTMLVQGGGTAVWDGPLRRLASQLLEPRRRQALTGRQLNLVVWFPGKALGRETLRRLDGLQRVRRLRPVRGGTIQSLLAAVDFLLLRPGGGSVNDALAHRKPFACVREPGQSQIEAILGECQRRRLTRAVEIEEFAADPLATILRQVEALESRESELVARMSEVPDDSAGILARQILDGVR